MTEKSHNRYKKKLLERSSSNNNKHDEASSYSSDIFQFTEMFKSLNIIPDSKNYQSFDNQKLMSEIGKLFFTSMMKFSNILKSHNSINDQNYINNNNNNTTNNNTNNNNNINKNQFKGSKNNNKYNKEKDNNENKKLILDNSLNNKYRKNNKNKKNKIKENKNTKDRENINLKQIKDTNEKYLNTYKNKLNIDKDKLSNDKIYINDKDKLLPTVRDNEYIDYGTSTQCENIDVNFIDFQAPTPINQNDEKQKLNLNIYRFINNCVSINKTTTTDTYIQTSDSNYYNYPSLNESNLIKDKFINRNINTNLNNNNNNNNLEGYNKDKLNINNTNISNIIVPMTTDEDRLLIRCFGGDLDSVKKLKGCDLEFVDQVGRSAIHYACTSGNMELVKYLITNNVDIDKKDVKGWTPLFIAIVKNHVEIVKLLIDNGADLSQTLRHRCAPTRLTDAHSLPIHFAAIKSNKDITELLIRSNVDINEKDSQGITPLSYSCYRGDYEYIKYLLENGANPTIQDVNGRTSYHSVALGGSLKVAKLLYEKSGIQNYQDRWSLTPSKLAQIKGYIQLSEFLIQNNNINQNTLDTNGITINTDLDDSDDMYLLLSTTIASALNESNSDQIYRCLIRLGPDVVKTLFELTLKVEKNGGVTTADGKRPRTPGGVFFTLLKQMHLNNYITKEDYQYIRAAEKERLKSINHNHTNNKNIIIGNTNNKGNNNKYNKEKDNKNNNNENKNKFNNGNQNKKVYKQKKNSVKTRNYE